GRKRCTDGSVRRKSTRATRRRTTTSPSLTNMKVNSPKHAKRTTRRSSSTRTIPSFVRTMSSSRKSMIARTAAKILSLAALVAFAAAGCTSIVEIPIETPIQAKLDVSPFSRVLVAGFVAGGSDDVDGNFQKGKDGKRK